MLTFVLVYIVCFVISVPILWPQYKQMFRAMDKLYLGGAREMSRDLQRFRRDVRRREEHRALLERIRRLERELEIR